MDECKRYFVVVYPCFAFANTAKFLHIFEPWWLSGKKNSCMQLCKVFMKIGYGFNAFIKIRDIEFLVRAVQVIAV